MTMTETDHHPHPPPPKIKITLPPNHPPIHTATVTAPTNIAVIKYWGKASSHHNTPINSSLSLTLSQSHLRAVTTATASHSFHQDTLYLNGKQLIMSPATLTRFQACINGMRALSTHRHSNGVHVSPSDWTAMPVHIASYNTFPTAAGLASSAAGYAALVAALAELYGAEESYPGEFTGVARRGSGSACRSLLGGFVAWRAGGEREDWSDSIAEQVVDEWYWEEVRAVILVVSDEEKETSSTVGMETSVETSELLKYRAGVVVPGRMEEMEEAIRRKDFESFGRLTMMDSNQFHAVCLDTYPPIFYMNDVSKSVIQMVHAYNDWAGEIRAAYTFDAGPNAVLYTLEKYTVELLALVLRYYPGEKGCLERYVNDVDLKNEAMTFALDPSLMEAVEKRCKVHNVGDVKMIYCTRGGPGPHTLDESESLFEFVSE